MLSRSLFALALAWLTTSCARTAGEPCGASSDCKAGLSCCGGTCADTERDLANCGGCAQACAGLNAGAICLKAVCRLACSPGFGDCNGSGADGCEADLATDAAHCGACRLSCSHDHAAGVCRATQCSLGGCDDGYADCDRQGGNGCEVHVAESVDHCGACGRRCLLPHGTARCQGGACAVASCDTGWGDCDGSGDGGCEANLWASSKHCGGCNRPCAQGNACVDGACRPAELLLFGGFTDSSEAVAIADVWRFDFVAKTWAVVPVSAGATPQARGYHSAVWDKAGNRLLVFGGYDGTSLVPGDTWALDFSVAPPVWSRLNVTGAPPTARIMAATGWDPATRRWYLFGGVGAFSSTALSDLYVLDVESLTWTQLALANPPAGRMLAAGGWDQATNQFVVHGGNTDFSTDLDDLWAIDPAAATPTWTQRSATGAPTARSGHAFFDGTTPLALFGGGRDMYGAAPAFFREVQVLELTGPSWKSAGGVGPASRAFAATATLGTSRYLYGGMSWDANSSETVFSDTWELELPSGTWTELHAGGADAPPVQHAMSVVGKL